MSVRFLPAACAAGLFLFLSACGGSGERDIAALERASRALVPSDAGLAEIYNRSCRSCHTIAATGAPLTGDTEAWRERIGKGLDVMLESVISGSGGMPPFGMCMECDAVQFEDLILFMANVETAE